MFSCNLYLITHTCTTLSCHVHVMPVWGTYLTGKMILCMAYILWSSTIYQTCLCITQSWLCKLQLHLLEILSVNLSKHVLSFAKSSLYALLCYARRSAGAVMSQFSSQVYIEGILPKGPYLPCVSMAGRALLAGYHRIIWHIYIFIFQKHMKHSHT